MANRLAYVELSKIRANPAALREVNRNSEKFLSICESVKNKGVLNAVLLREIPNPENPSEMLYGLADGLHRFTAAQEVDLKEIPAQITSMEDGEVEEAQIIANICRVDTKPVEYTKGLIRMLQRNPFLTEAELAAKLSQSPSWLKERLNLVKLDDGLQLLVDEGKINLANAYALAKLPVEEQKDFADRAMTLAPAQFIPAANARAKEIKAAAQQGRSASPATFAPVAHLRKMKELKEEMDLPAVGLALTVKHSVKTAEDGFALGVAWALNMDPDSVEFQRVQDETRKKVAAEAKAKAAVERDTKKKEKAAADLAVL